MFAGSNRSVAEIELKLASSDMPANSNLGRVVVDLNKYDFHKIHPNDLVQPLPNEVQQLIQDAAERRLMALGSFYKYLQPSDDDLKQVESELRKAQTYEIIASSKRFRERELDSLRELALEGQAQLRDQRQRLLLEMQSLRPKSLNVLAKAAEHIKVEETLRLEEDRKSVLLRERNVLLERRRVFEQASGGDAARAATAAGAAQPVLVMNVALGNGKEEQIVVRRHDDPGQVAALFVRKHHLPDHTITTLANQIRVNLTQSVHATTGRAATPTNASRLPRTAGRSPVVTRR